MVVVIRSDRGIFGFPFSKSSDLPGVASILPPWATFGRIDPTSARRVAAVDEQIRESEQ